MPFRMGMRQEQRKANSRQECHNGHFTNAMETSGIHKKNLQMLTSGWQGITGFAMFSLQESHGYLNLSM